MSPGTQPTPQVTVRVPGTQPTTVDAGTCPRDQAHGHDHACPRAWPTSMGDCACPGDPTHPQVTVRVPGTQPTTVHAGTCPGARPTAMTACPRPQSAPARKSRPRRLREGAAWAAAAAAATSAAAPPSPTAPLCSATPSLVSGGRSPSARGCGDAGARGLC